MSDKRYQVVFTGKLVPNADMATVKANLVLDIGLSEEKVERMLSSSRVVLKRFPSVADAQRLIERMERAGVLCQAEDLGPAGQEGAAPGESALVSFVNRLIPSSRSSRRAVVTVGKTK